MKSWLNIQEKNSQKTNLFKIMMKLLVVYFSCLFVAMTIVV